MKQYQIKSFGLIDGLSMVDAPEPKAGHGQVLVRVKAVSLNYRDLMIVEDRYGKRGSTPAGRVPVSDCVAEIVTVGEGVKNFKACDRVCGIFHPLWLGGELDDSKAGETLGGEADGVLTQMRLFDQDKIVHAPAYMTDEQAATLPCAAVTAWSALHGPRPVRAGDTVLTQGTGGVSVFAIQFAHAAGARVIATSSGDDKLQKAKALGATDGINYKQHPEWDGEVLKLTRARGVDHVIEVGGPDTLNLSLKSVARNGQIHVIGLLSGGGAQVNPLMLIPRAASLRGIYVGSRDQFEAMNKALIVNKIEPVIDRVFEFAQAKEAYTHLKSGAHVGKIVIRVS